MIVDITHSLCQNSVCNPPPAEKHTQQYSFLPTSVRNNLGNKFVPRGIILQVWRSCFLGASVQYLPHCGCLATVQEEQQCAGTWFVSGSGRQ